MAATDLLFTALRPFWLGCLATATGRQLPGSAMRAVEMLAESASPAARFTIGAVLARSRVATSAVVQPPARRRDVPLLVAYEVAVHPALVYAAGRAAIALGVPLEHDALVVLATTALAFISFPFAVALVK